MTQPTVVSDFTANVSAEFVSDGTGTETVLTNVTLGTAATDRRAFVLVLGVINRQIVSATLGGVSMTAVAILNTTVSGTTYHSRAALFELPESSIPAGSAADVSVSINGGGAGGGQAYYALFSGTNQGAINAATFEETAGAGSPAGSTAVSLTTSHADSLLHVVGACRNPDTAGVTMSGGMTQLRDNAAGWGFIERIAVPTSGTAFSETATYSASVAGASIIAFEIGGIAGASNTDPALDTPISDISVPANMSGTIVDISGNFSDADLDTLTYSVTPALPSGMTLNTTTGVISGNGSITVTAAANYTFSADDGNGGTPASDVVSITVTAPAFSVDSVSGGDQPGESWLFALSNASGSGMTANIGSTALTVTAQDSSSITVTIPDLLTFDGGIYRFSENLTVEIVDGANSDTIATLITPATGFAQVQMPDPIAGVWASSTFEAAISPGVLAIGDYIHCTAPTDSDPENGIFPEDSTIVYRIMDMSDGTPVWGTAGTITIPSTADTTPAAFTLTDVADQNLSTVVESNTITVTDVDVATDVAISITGGEYAVSTDGGSSFGSWTSASGNVQLNHQVKVRGTSSASYSTAVNVVLTVGGVSDTFSITTKADDVAPVITLTGDATINLVEGDTYTEQGATWTDNVDGSGAATVGGDTVDTNTVGSYVVTYDYTDAAGNAATQVTRTVNVTAAPDTTAPVLSSPTATVNGAYAATGTVSTDESGGTLYVLVSTNSTETASTIKASINNQPVTSTGVQNISASGLSPETTYYIHYVQVDSAGNTSNVVSSTSFTTEAATSGGFDSWDEWMASLDAGTFTTKLRTFLQGKGYSGSTSTMLYEYLKTVSSKASHQERKKDWEEGGWN